MAPEEIARMAIAAGFGAVVNEERGEVIVPGEEGPVAVVSPLLAAPAGSRCASPQRWRRASGRRS
jgi:hypothetical protein